MACLFPSAYGQNHPCSYREIILPCLLTLLLCVCVLCVCALLGCSGSSDDGSDVQNPSTPAEIKSYDDCVAAGYPILETFPLQCQAADGTIFVDTPKEPVLGENPTCQDLCGDGECQEAVCLAEGCPCAESEDTCQKDCA